MEVSKDIMKFNRKISQKAEKLQKKFQLMTMCYLTLWKRLENNRLNKKELLDMTVKY